MNFSKHLYWVLPLSMVIATTGSINASYAGFDFKNKTKQTIAVPDLEPTRIIIDTPARRAPVRSPSQQEINRNAPNPKAELKTYKNGERVDAYKVLPVIEPAAEKMHQPSASAPLLPLSAVTQKIVINENVDTWKADAGEPLRDVISRWSERANVDLVWALEDERVIVESVSHFGKFEGALVHLFDVGMAGTVEGELSYAEEGTMFDEGYAPAASVPVAKPMPIVEAQTLAASTQIQASPVCPCPTKDNAKLEGQKWKAQKGQSLGDILLEWEKAGDYQLIWDYPMDVALKHDFFAYGRVEEAISMLLEQFYNKNNNMRPVGDIYQDPQSGLKYLHIKGSI